MVEEIDKMREQLETLLKTHDINDEIVLEVSQKLDKLILQYYDIEGKDSKPDIKDQEEKYSIKRAI